MSGEGHGRRWMVEVESPQAEATDDTTDGLGDELATHELQPKLAD